MYILLSCKSTVCSVPFYTSKNSYASQQRLMIFVRRLPNNNATGCTGNPWSDWVSDDIAASSGVCYNNQAYYLFDVAGGPCNDLKERGTGPGILPCPNTVLSELPGIKTMDGTAWGGVTRDNLAIRYDLSPSLALFFSFLSPHISFHANPKRGSITHTSSSHPLHQPTQKLTPHITPRPQLNHKTVPYKPIPSTTTPTAIKCPNSQT